MKSYAKYARTKVLKEKIWISILSMIAKSIKSNAKYARIKMSKEKIWISIYKFALKSLSNVSNARKNLKENI